MSGGGELPSYTDGTSQGQRSPDVTDSKSLPPQYLQSSESSGVAQGPARSTGDTKGTKISGHSKCPPNLRVHATAEAGNLALLSGEGRPVYFVDNTSSLSKTLVKVENKEGPIISTCRSAGPFLKEMIVEYESRVRSGAHSTTVVANGRFTVVWDFAHGGKSLEWKHHKGVWSLRQDDIQIATYNVGESLSIKEDFLHISDAIVSTISAIDLFARLSSERRHRALNSVSGKSTSGMLGGGLLL